MNPCGVLPMNLPIRKAMSNINNISNISNISNNNYPKKENHPLQHRIVSHPNMFIQEMMTMIFLIIQVNLSMNEVWNKPWPLRPMEKIDKRWLVNNYWIPMETREYIPVSFYVLRVCHMDWDE
mmetsp:Transcript_8839/g.25463  ORF Transcript_8839/g.25463 Transcript_8839/m.25463 type:complete len:123 (+) Transcript_8839:841-1209(+)